MSKQITGGIQFAAFLVRRCRFASGAVCVRMVFTVADEVSKGEQ
jgi:hypothetical protein